MSDHIRARCFGRKHAKVYAGDSEWLSQYSPRVGEALHNCRELVKALNRLADEWMNNGGTFKAEDSSHAD